MNIKRVDARRRFDRGAQELARALVVLVGKETAHELISAADQSCTEPAPRGVIGLLQIGSAACDYAGLSSACIATDLALEVLQGNANRSTS